MVFDHIHYFFDYTGKIPIWFAMIGRLAAPLFLFSVIEGFIHTRNRKKYFLKIYVLAILMGLIQFGFYNFLHPLVRPDGFFPKNMMLSSFAILLVALQGIAWIQEKKYLKGIPTSTFPIISASMVNGTFCICSASRQTDRHGFFIKFTHFHSVASSYIYQRWRNVVAFDWYRYVSLSQES